MAVACDEYGDRKALPKLEPHRALHQDGAARIPERHIELVLARLEASELGDADAIDDRLAYGDHLPVALLGPVVDAPQHAINGRELMTGNKVRPEIDEQLDPIGGAGTERETQKERSTELDTAEHSPQNIMPGGEIHPLARRRSTHSLELSVPAFSNGYGRCMRIEPLLDDM